MIDIEIGFGNIGLAAVFALSSAISLDFLLGLFSQRFSLASGGFQVSCLNRMGQSFWLDGLMGALLQFVSLRRRAFLSQLAGFVNVGSFSRLQVMAVVLGAGAGAGLTLFLFLSFVDLTLAVPLMVGGFALGLIPNDRLADFGVACLTLGAAIAVVFVFHTFLEGQSVGHLPLQLSWVFGVGLVAIAALVFQTQVPTLFLLTFLIYCKHVSFEMLPYFLTVAGVFSGFQFLLGPARRRPRLRFLGLMALMMPGFQLLVYLSVFHFSLTDVLEGWVAFAFPFEASETHFLFLFFAVILSDSLFNIGALFLMPLFYGVGRLTGPSTSENVKSDSQKILPAHREKEVFSLHFSLQLLRQEFIKMATLFHTVLKFGREAHGEAKEVSYRLRKYTFVLERVAYELKELCFSVGRQRAYRGQITEILNYYKLVNHMELMMVDLTEVIEYLQKVEGGGIVEKECRLWLNLQMKLFEDFYSRLVNIPVQERVERFESLGQKSYEAIDRLVHSSVENQQAQSLSKALHRVTDGNLELCHLSPS